MASKLVTLRADVASSIQALHDLEGRAAGPKIDSLLWQAGTEIRQAVEPDVPVGKTGNLKSGLEQKWGRGTAKNVIVWMNRKIAPHLHLVAGGTKPHVIKAKPGGALFWAGAANPVDEVMHPGSKKNRFFQKAVARVQKDVLARLTQRVKDEIERGLQSGN